MKFEKLTLENVSKYVGYQVIFKTRNSYVIKRILNIKNRCVGIDHPDLKNNLEFVSRNVYVLID